MNNNMITNLRKNPDGNSVNVIDHIGRGRKLDQAIIDTRPKRRNKKFSLKKYV